MSDGLVRRCASSTTTTRLTRESADGVPEQLQEGRPERLATGHHQGSEAGSGIDPGPAERPEDRSRHDCRIVVALCDPDHARRHLGVALQPLLD